MTSGDKLVIEGGRPLEGDVYISGAKNSVLKLMAAALLTTGAVRLENVPNLSDVAVMTQVVQSLGKTVSFAHGVLDIEAGAVTSCVAPYELVSQMRASFNVLGALLGRYGEAKVSLPGGCSIGKRGVDLHVKGLQALGAEVLIEHGYVEARAQQLHGAKILLDTPSVGATENIMLAAVLAEGATIISNAAREPEIEDLANFLNALGADVSGAGTHEIVINGVRPDQLHGVSYSVMCDRIEAGTFMAAAAGTRGQVVIHRITPQHLDFVMAKLSEMGADIQLLGPTTVQVSGPQRLTAQNLVTQPYPGFPTDLQAPFMSLLTIAEGTSIVTETIYENRFKQVGELTRMGAQIQLEGDIAVVTGVEKLSGAPVQAHDLRAGAAMIVAGLQTEGETEIHKLHHIDRGYERVVEKLKALGASIERVPADDSEKKQVVETP
ncbi:MAG: UDP-N-acetylglucosamine 1-carboxyvinyltransferase [Candidatus Melainabacteria bacterium]|nr:UDP-N-acetylglucosamine 1-carboxyvinyltransferase [Candidatus Melainabacteria bacterium]